MNWAGAASLLAATAQLLEEAESGRTIRPPFFISPIESHGPQRLPRYAASVLGFSSGANSLHIRPSPVQEVRTMWLLKNCGLQKHPAPTEGPAPGHARRRRVSSFRPWLSQLEDRTLPSLIPVVFAPPV